MRIIEVLLDYGASAIEVDKYGLDIISRMVRNCCNEKREKIISEQIDNLLNLIRCKRNDHYILLRRTSQVRGGPAVKSKRTFPLGPVAKVALELGQKNCYDVLRRHEFF